MSDRRDIIIIRRGIEVDPLEVTAEEAVTLRDVGALTQAGAQMPLLDAIAAVRILFRLLRCP